jgi:hypothetical protein
MTAEEKITILFEALESITMSMRAHPDCTEGSEFDDMVSIAQEAMDSVVKSESGRSD